MVFYLIKNLFFKYYKNKGRVEKIQELFNSENTYHNVLSVEIASFLEEAKEFIKDKEIEELLNSFNKIKKIHSMINEDLSSQRKESQDWNNLIFTNSFLNIYPQAKDDYILFCNGLETFVRKIRIFFEMFSNLQQKKK